MSFGRDIKSRWSLLSGVYGRVSKRSRTGGKCVTCSGLTNSRWTLKRLQRPRPVSGRTRKGERVNEDGWWTGQYCSSGGKKNTPVTNIWMSFIPWMGLRQQNQTPLTDRSGISCTPGTASRHAQSHSPLPEGQGSSRDSADHNSCRTVGQQCSQAGHTRHSRPLDQLKTTSTTCRISAVVLTF